jgi:hypothetical protein
MPKPFHLTICPLLLTLAVLASGCGSTETASTSKTASAKAGASAPAGETSRTASQGTTLTTAPHGATAPSHNASPTNKHQATVPGTSTEASKPKTTAARPKRKAAIPLLPPPRHVFPAEATRAFISVCRTAGESSASCECMVAQFEARNVEEGHSLAELLGAEVSLKDHEMFLPGAKLIAKKCKFART